ncbi:MAG: molybdopterin-binding protein [Paracoccaceae bacterium]
MTNPSAAILLIGDEILSGRTQDSNGNFLARALYAHGIDLREIRVVGDVEATIVTTLNALRTAYDHVFTSGGIGPTHDDITADAVAAAFDVALIERDDAVAALARNYKNGVADLTPARRRMARVPEGSSLIHNPVSGAPGFTMGNVHVMAGVPAVFQAMVDGLLPGLAGGVPLLSESMRIHLPESQIATPLAAIASAFPDLSFGSYPFIRDGKFGADIVVRGVDKAQISAALERLREIIS